MNKIRWSNEVYINRTSIVNVETGRDEYLISASEGRVINTLEISWQLRNL